jgi:hypothetical protein
METILRDVNAMMERLSFPADARAVLDAALRDIAADAEATAWLCRAVAEYEKNVGPLDYKRLLKEGAAHSERLGMHGFTMSMLFFLCLGHPLLRRYAACGISEAVFDNTMADLRYKLEECRLVYGVVGSFVPSWFIGFFELTRFGLGRLQFEIVHTKRDHMVGGALLPAGSAAINVHIPRSGERLRHDAVMDSYRAAAEWFADRFPEGEPVFTCHSWLLYPWNLEVLATGSNLAAFIGDYEVVESEDYGDYQEVWRLFDCHFTGSAADLPQDSSLRRAYADRIARGEPTGYGRGFFRYR